MEKEEKQQEENAPFACRITYHYVCDKMSGLRVLFLMVVVLFVCCTPNMGKIRSELCFLI